MGNMKMKKLFLMCGPSGAGKTTYIEKILTSLNIKGIHISRDKIRFSMLNENDDYFAYEDAVFDTFCSDINRAIEDDEFDFIFVDATHLSEKARNKTLDRLNLDEVELSAVNFNIPVETCLEQNEKRSGRSYVPRSVIRRMCSQFVPAHKNEKYKYENILWVGDVIDE